MEAADASEDRYSLRPRAAGRREPSAAEAEAEAGAGEGWPPRRGRARSRPQKSAPLSKYRRKTANARERFRMREINEAFETLRRAVPRLEGACEPPGEKLTKISTLRLAMRYIAALTGALADPEARDDWGSADWSSAGWSSADRSSADRNSDDRSSADRNSADWRVPGYRNSADSGLRSPYFSPSPSSDGSSCGLSALLPSPADFRCSLAPSLSPEPASLLDQLDALPSPDVDLDDFFVT